MARVNFVSLLALLALIIMFSCFPAVSGNENSTDYVHDACEVTRYRDLCVHSLSPFSNAAKHNPSMWARAGVSVTIEKAKRVAQYLEVLKKSSNKTTRLKRGMNRSIALSDCVESFQDTLDNLHKSLGVLRKLSVREFSSQLDDVMTWVSAALTDEDTCVDGFEGKKGSKRVKNLINRVSTVTYLTSNALALVNKLATAGPNCLKNY